MNVYDRIIKDFLTIPHIKPWQEIQKLMQQVASEKPGHWLLPLHVCDAVGGDPSQTISALLAIACSHVGIVLVDDMLDVDVRGEYRKVGEAAAANMACALQSAALTSVARCDINSTSKLNALASINEMFLATALGQYWDVQSHEVDEEKYWRIAKTKSSPFFGTAFQLGALVGGASIELASSLKELGYLYGEMIQIHDDLHDTMAKPANADWIEHRSPLPILFACLVDHPMRARFKEIFPYAGYQAKALEEAQEILIQCGAVSYCVYQLLEREKMVKEILSGLSLERRDVLEKVFDDIVEPVSKLFHEVDKTSI